MFQVKAGYDLKLLTPETIKLLGSSKYKINKDKNVENGSHLEITNNDCHRDSRVLYAFVPNKAFGQLLDISPKNYMFL